MSFRLSNAKKAKVWSAGEVFYFTSSRTSSVVRLKVKGMGINKKGKRTLIGREDDIPETRWNIPATTKNLKNISKTTKAMKHQEPVEEIVEAMKRAKIV
jgi:hypothetical protein